MKNVAKILVAVCCVFLVLLLVKRVNRDYVTFWNANTISVTVDNLDKTKVKIIAGVSMLGDTHPDDTCPVQCYGGKLIYSGSLKEPLISDYGENDFIITYADSYYCAFRHYIFNWHYQHGHYFHFSRKSGKILISVTIKGQDNMYFAKNMNALKPWQYIRYPKGR